MSSCSADQVLRCEGNNLVRCNKDGTAEVAEGCPLGCIATGPRCNDVDPSNRLAQYLDIAEGEPDFNLGSAATINTDDGSVVVDGNPVVIRSMMMPQAFAPMVTVFVVHGLIAADVSVTGRNAIAVVSHGDVKLTGLFSASAQTYAAGPGGFNEGTCRGLEGAIQDNVGVAGNGGGGFGFAGGPGGAARNNNGTVVGGKGGTAVGNQTLVPLRGGCDSGTYGARLIGYAGGAVQVVSRTRIEVSGVAAANGRSGSGGGSGGGILLEAPVVEVSGTIVANGGAGAGGCLFPLAGEDGRLDAMAAKAGLGCTENFGADGGTGGAALSGAGVGRNGDFATNFSVWGGHGGGGVGRIRVNTAAGGFRSTGLFSPPPSTGTVATR